MKRQIIKTKPVRPYRVARAVVATIVVIAIALAAWFVWERGHAAHALPAPVRVVVQDSPRAPSNAQTPIVRR